MAKAAAASLSKRQKDHFHPMDKGGCRLVEQRHDDRISGKSTIGEISGGATEST